MEIELAIYEDCLNLIDKFVQCKNPSFRTFCEQWKNCMFQHIYAAQTTAIEVIQTTKTILHLAKRIVCAKDELGKLASEHNDKTQIIRRIGGIYLMYAVYFKQPTKQFVKVLVSYETWHDILKFIENLPTHDMTDEARYIFWYLYKADAFRFTALDYDVGLEKLVDYDRLYDIHKGNITEEVVRVKLKQKLIAITETEKVLPDMVALEMKYNKTKESINATKSANPLPATKIFQDIQDALKNIQYVLDEKNTHNIATTSKNGSNYDEKRKDLKRKAAGRSNNTIFDEESGVEDSCQQEIKKYFGKPSVRQIMSQELPEHLNEDLKNSSTEDEDVSCEPESFENYKDDANYTSISD